MHPISIQGIVSNDGNVCAIAPILDEDADTKWWDSCELEDNNTHELPDIKQNLMLSFRFNPEEFLRYVYAITTFDDAIYWSLDNDDYPQDTIKRVLNSAWLAFGNTDSITDVVVTYYRDIITNQWIEAYIYKLREDHEFTIEGDLKETLTKDYLTKPFIAKALKQFLKRKDWREYYDYHIAVIWFVYHEMVNKMSNKDIE